MSILQKQVPDYLPTNINQYVPACAMVADARNGDATRISLGTPAVADTDGLLNGVDTTATSGDITVTGNALLGAIGATADAPYGRNVTVTGAGAGSKVLTIKGKDYLGQPMQETITCTTGDGAGVKAFKVVDTITLGAVAGDSDTDFGWGDVLGLPFKCIKILSEEADGVTEATLGTHVGPVLTDPQTATTGDPRGTYNPQTTLDGSAEITVTAIFDNSVNSSGNGGYHGISHYNG